MTQKPENPLAFPFRNPAYDGNWDKDYGSGGMTLRDYFAAAALQGICVNSKANREEDFPILASTVSELSYLIADAMLKARQV